MEANNMLKGAGLAAAGVGLVAAAPVVLPLAAMSGTMILGLSVAGSLLTGVGIGGALGRYVWPKSVPLPTLPHAAPAPAVGPTFNITLPQGATVKPATSLQAVNKTQAAPAPAAAAPAPATQAPAVAAPHVLVATS